MKKDANYYAEHKLKPPKSFFEWCYYHMETYEWANKNEKIVGSERKHYYTNRKRLTKNSRLTFFDKRRFFMIVLSTSKRIEVQTHCISSHFRNGKQFFEDRLINLERFSDSEHIKIGREISDFKFGLTPVGSMFTYSLPEIYDNGWHQKIQKNSELKYIKLWNFYLDDMKYIYKYRKEIEFAQKIGANKLSIDIGNHNQDVDMRVITQNWLNRNKQFLKNSSRGLKETELRAAIEKRGGKMVLGVEEYLSESEVHLIPMQVGVVKFQNWLIKQKVYFSYYEDYLSMLEDIDIPLTKSNILPKDIRIAHDKAAETLNAMRRETEREGFGKRAKKLAEMEITINGFAFILPKTADDLIREGQKLKHCVGSSRYIERHASGKSTIIFIRKLEEPERPFCTLEYERGEIVQVRGEKNQKATKEVKEATENWLEWVRKGCKHGKKKVQNQKEKASAA